MFEVLEETTHLECQCLKYHQKRDRAHLVLSCKFQILLKTQQFSKDEARDKCPSIHQNGQLDNYVNFRCSQTDIHEHTDTFQYLNNILIMFYTSIQLL